ncbi:MAG: leucyl/phenylalanyl-tRNA--protein transferase [Ginsengibacter sp.]
MEFPEFILAENSTNFPPVETADENGILAIGSNLQVPTLLKAYKLGAFPWYGPNEPIIWYHPDPRFVLFPKDIKISRSMRSVLNSGKFLFKVNTDFKSVVRNCRIIQRKDQENAGTWITDAIEEAYFKLFQEGHAISAEAWKDNKLVGGLYGVRMGNVFFGESMFAQESNASKFAFIKLIHLFKKQGVELIDCQVYTDHLHSLGAEHISRNYFIDLLQKLIP